MTLLDTADMYAAGRNEELVGRAVRGRRDVIVATKFGNVLDDSGRPVRVDGSPDHVRRSCEASLRRLGLETIDLYQQHRVDPNTPIEETVGALAELVRAGKVRAIGLSEAVPEEIRRAAAVHPIATVQSEYSVLERGVEDGVLQVCEELGIGFLAYAPLVRGLLAGSLGPGLAGDLDDARTTGLLPRVTTHLVDNASLAAVVAEVAASHGATPGQVALAWLLGRRPWIVPIPGTKRVAYLEENVGAVALTLSAADIERLDGLAALVRGSRYAPESPFAPHHAR